MPSSPEHTLDPIEREHHSSDTEPDVRPENRALSITPEALAFLGRMGAAYLPAPTLFTLWKVWLQEPDRARSHVERLHAQDGGTFQLSLP